MVSVRVLGSEVAAIGKAAVWLTNRFGGSSVEFDRTAPHPTPLVFVHGFLGDRTNFHGIRAMLGARGVTNVAHFEYAPRLDWPRLATRLGHALDALVDATGVRRVDVLGHSLGGLVARHLLEMRADTPIRRPRDARGALRRLAAATERARGLRRSRSDRARPASGLRPACAAHAPGRSLWSSSRSAAIGACSCTSSSPAR
jgi:pimeloyl-ACP methyl ester carboxylesterase